ncbi:ATP-binding cassette domain-containing protein [Paraburkholderia sp. 1N]|uniref:ATP-binding cassette domain-containing protein n=1 Tax=Paraburkholderia solitsugae TaxID=2675748 RepID=A0ABX2BVC5_9BURK|nr:sugar ABC transporter ATP-binding protein [Paraburkholderia solitsugae]NPT44837.1 ATP-binding cassette domain-containing protein [Paraburkholderia solitsugae]
MNSANDKAVADAVISLQNISKSFGPRKVLDGVNLTLSGGQVHALLGQNGSGKSTLIKILSGVYQPDDTDRRARMVLRGEPINLPPDADFAATAGIAAVHQDLPIISSASVLENLMIGRFETGLAWRIDWRRVRNDVARALGEFGIHATPEQAASELPEADRAMLAILRGLQGLPPDRPGVLILDEPTAHLPRDGVDRVFAAIRRVASQGHAVLLVTHRFDEVFAVTDRVSVIRDGVIAHVASTGSCTERELIRAILGFDLDALYPERETNAGEIVLDVDNLCGKRVQNMDFAVRRGEVVGITGLIGAGQEEIPYLLFGARRASSGSIAVCGQSFSQAELSPAKSIRAGMALLPADRRNASGVGAASVRENVSLPVLQRFFKNGFLREKAERNHVHELLGRFEVRPSDPELPLSALSGGNQQKALLAKWFQMKPDVLLLHEPTHGVDVGSRRTIFRMIKDAADAGAAIVLFSTEYADLANLCDRVVVMRNGQKSAELSGSTLGEQRIVAECMMEG